MVALYDGFGRNDRALVFGRALRDERVAPATAEDGRVRNLLAMIRRADADPIPHAVVRVIAGDFSKDVVADDEGFFHTWIDASNAARVDDEWITVEAQLKSGNEGEPEVMWKGRILLPAYAPEFIVVSDVDDTVLQSKVTNLLRAAQTLAFGNARTRLPFPGVAALYQALRRGALGSARNPLFYVSSSPWNLHDVISQFLEIQGIPAGPVMLRDLDINFGTLSSRRHHEHKREMIHRILRTFEDVPAILIGDSSQQDPEIYRDVVHEFSGRVLAVYIRNVTQKPQRSQAIQQLAEEIVKTGSSLVLADDTMAAAEHAVQRGFIHAGTLAAIRDDKRADEGVTDEKADAPGSRDAGDKPAPTVIVD
jgi:phosphatidate phosphatase APP1